VTGFHSGGPTSRATANLLVAILRAHGFDLSRWGSLLLLFLDAGQHSAHVFFLRHRGVGDALLMQFEGTAGQGDALAQMISMFICVRWAWEPETRCAYHY